MRLGTDNPWGRGEQNSGIRSTERKWCCSEGSSEHRDEEGISLRDGDGTHQSGSLQRGGGTGLPQYEAPSSHACFLLPTPGCEEDVDKVSSIFTVPLHYQLLCTSLLTGPTS